MAASAIIVATALSLRPREAGRIAEAPPATSKPEVAPPPPPASVATPKPPPESKAPSESKAPALVPGLKLDEAAMASFKAATVRVRRATESGEKVEASGFVARVDGNRCFIVTCRRIVEEFDFARDGFGGDMRLVTLGGIAGVPRKTVPERWWAFGIETLGKGLPPSEAFPSPSLGVATEVEVIFGEKHAKPRPGKVLLVDGDAGLALVEVEGPGRPLSPITVGSAGESAPGAPMFALGRQANGSGNDGNDAASILGGFSGEEKASAKKIEEMRFRAEIDAGFEGGPVFDEKGRFAGAIGVATRDGGVTISSARVAELLRPRLGALRVMTPLAAMAPRGEAIPARVSLVGGPWKEVNLICSAVRTGNPGDPLEKENGANSTPLTIANDRAFGEIQPKAIDLDGQLYCQAVGVRADGSTTRSESRLISVRPGGPRLKSEFEKRGLELFTDGAKFAGSYQYREDFGAHYLPARDDKDPLYAQEKDGAFIVETGLGARFLAPCEPGTKCACALSHTEISKGAIRLTAISTRVKSGVVYFGGSVQGGGWLTGGMDRSEIQRIARDVFIEAFGASTAPAEFEIGDVKGIEFTIERARLSGARESGDQSTLRVVVVAKRGAVHFFGRLGTPAGDPFVERFFSSFELPAKTRIRPPKSATVVSIKTGA